MQQAMNILVIAEHDNQQIQAATLNTLQAATELKAITGGAIELLVMGYNCQAVADQASTFAIIDKVILADAEPLVHQLPENSAALVSRLAGQGYSHILAAATTTGKNLLPRVAALLDVAQISDIVEVISTDTLCARSMPVTRWLKFRAAIR